jgi:hypothetical protein
MQGPDRSIPGANRVDPAYDSRGDLRQDLSGEMRDSPCALMETDIVPNIAILSLLCGSSSPYPTTVSSICFCVTTSETRLHKSHSLAVSFHTKFKWTRYLLPPSQLRSVRRSRTHIASTVTPTSRRAYPSGDFRQRRAPPTRLRRDRLGPRRGGRLLKRRRCGRFGLRRRLCRGSVDPREGPG